MPPCGPVTMRFAPYARSLVAHLLRHGQADRGQPEQCDGADHRGDHGHDGTRTAAEYRPEHHGEEHAPVRHTTPGIAVSGHEAPPRDVLPESNGWMSRRAASTVAAISTATRMNTIGRSVIDEENTTCPISLRRADAQSGTRERADQCDHRGFQQHEPRHRAVGRSDRLEQREFGGPFRDRGRPSGSPRRWLRRAGSGRS